MSDEKFMEKTRTWLDDLKIRAGYGTTGNSNIDHTTGRSNTVRVTNIYIVLMVPIQKYTKVSE